MPSFTRSSPASSRIAGLLAAALVAFAGCVVVSADEDNPFARPGAGGAQGPAQPASPLDTLEFRGVMTISGTTFVTLFNTADSKSSVISLGGSNNGISVSEYQPDNDSVLVQAGANSKRLTMKKAQIVAMAVPPPQPVAQPGTPPGTPAAVGGVPTAPGQPGAMGDEEVRARMERVATEIRRRREMRREIMERAQQQQPQQPAGTP